MATRQPHDGGDRIVYTARDLLGVGWRPRRPKHKLVDIRNAELPLDCLTHHLIAYLESIEYEDNLLEQLKRDWERLCVQSLPTMNYHLTPNPYIEELQKAVSQVLNETALEFYQEEDIRSELTYICRRIRRIRPGCLELDMKFESLEEIKHFLLCFVSGTVAKTIYQSHCRVILHQVMKHLKSENYNDSLTTSAYVVLSELFEKIVKYELSLEMNDLERMYKSANGEITLMMEYMGKYENEEQPRHKTMPVEWLDQFYKAMLEDEKRQKVLKLSASLLGEKIPKESLDKESKPEEWISFVEAAKEYGRNGEYKKAAEEIQAALALQRQRETENLHTAGLSKKLGKWYLKAGDNTKAIMHFKKALEIYESFGLSKEGNPEKMWHVYYYLGKSSSGQERIRNYSTAIQIVSETTLPGERFAEMHSEVGKTYFELGIMDLAKEYLEKARTMLTCFYPNGYNVKCEEVHGYLGLIYGRLGDEKSAESELNKVADICEHFKQNAAPWFSDLSETYADLGNEEREKHYKKKAQEYGDFYIAQSLSNNSEENFLEGTLGLWGLLEKNLSQLQDLSIHSEDIARAQQLQQNGKHKESIEYYEKAIKALEEADPRFSQNEKIQNFLSMCHNNVGNEYRRIGAVKEAEDHLRKALKIRQILFDDSEDTASAMFNLGHLYRQTEGEENNEKANELHESCLKIYMKLGGTANPQYKKWILSLYMSLSHGYTILDMHQKVVEYYEKAKELIQSDSMALIVDQDVLQAICNNLGNAYAAMEDYDKADENYMRSLKIAQYLEPDRRDDKFLQNHIASVLNNLGVMYQNKGDLDTSYSFLTQSLEIRRELSEHDMMALQELPSSFHSIGNTLLKMGKRSEALGYYKQESDARRNLGENVKDINLQIAKISSNMDDRGNKEAIDDIMLNAKNKTKSRSLDWNDIFSYLRI